jgi:hypothetical protein
VRIIATISLAIASATGCGFDAGSSGVDGVVASDAGHDAIDATGDDGGGIDADTVIARFNMGGPTVVGVDFPGEWLADPGTVCGGSTYSLAAEVTGTQDDMLFTFWRYSFSSIPCSVGVDLPAGQYEVTLVFGEIWIGPGCPYNGTRRIFDILVEGTVVENALDTVVVGGCCNENATTPGAPFTRSFAATIDGGAVDVELRAVQPDQAMISAIMLRQL